MPTYEYRCENCGYWFDKFQQMTDIPIKNCPKCNGTVYRLIGKGACVIYRGHGFYVNDYKHVTKDQKR